MGVWSSAWASARIAVRALRVNKLRSALTMLRVRQPELGHRHPGRHARASQANVRSVGSIAVKVREACAMSEAEQECKPSRTTTSTSAT